MPLLQLLCRCPVAEREPDLSQGAGLGRAILPNKLIHCRLLIIHNAVLYQLKGVCKKQGRC